MTMTREQIRAHKRTVARGLRADASDSDEIQARRCALALLEHSISLRHDRLAVNRLSLAVRAGAEVSESHWSYCEEAIRRSRDPSLVAMLQQAGKVQREAACGERERARATPPDQ